MSTTAKNLSNEAPRSPRNRLGGYALMARMIDKGRAVFADTVGEYHFACPLDQMLFEFKGVKDEEVKKLIGSGATDEQVINWFNTHGAEKSTDEINGWSDGVEAFHPYESPEKKDWFVGECARNGIDPVKSTLFDYLEADDANSFKK